MEWVCRSAICGALFAAACSLPNLGAPRIPPHPGIDAIWRQYVELPRQRALAIAGDPNGLWVGAAAGGAAAQTEASERALGECRRKRAQRRMQAPCLLYAVGDDIIWSGR